MNRKSLIGLLAMYGMVAVMGSEVTDFDGLPKRGENDGKSGNPPIIPRPYKGQKCFFFKANGEHATERILKEECVFQCYAINEKNAIKKFNRYIKNNKP